MTPVYLVAALALADALLTHRAIALGLREINPLLGRLLGARPPLVAGLLWRALVIVGLAWLAMPAPGWYVLAALQAAGVVWNVQKIRELRR